ncbi:MAG: S8 family serine peptidase [Verrucomicrobiota bacterium]
MRFSTSHCLRLLHCGWLTLASFMLPNTAFSQATAQVGGEPSFRSNDSGMVRVFHLALDEISVNRGGKQAPEMVNAASMADLLVKAQAARERENATPTPGEIELVAYEENAEHSQETRRIITRKLLIQYEAGTEAKTVAADLGLTLDATPNYAPGMAVVAADTSEAALAAMSRLRAHPQVTAADPLLARWWSKKSIPNDPLFSQQWHLRNTSQLGGAMGIDANVTPAWDTVTGKGVTLCIVDDGLQYTHPDLSPHYNLLLDWDFNDNDKDPMPYMLQNPVTEVYESDNHGTACAGVAAACGNNYTGVCGVAYEATLVGFRLIAGAITDQTMANAFALNNDKIQIKSNSWGPADNGQSLGGPGLLAQAALKDGVTTGRGGLGTIYLFAGGNGNGFNDNSNYDGFANSIYTIGIGAVNDYGFQTYYSEPGANLHVCAPSNGRKYNQGIVTTDIFDDKNVYGYNTILSTADLADYNYTRTFGGTSSACPLVAGVCALILEANPKLGWRDVQEILMRSAKQVHHADSDWITNGAGFHFNHKYGAGMVDAEAAVALAKEWVNLGPSAPVVRIQPLLAQENIPDYVPGTTNPGVTRTFEVTNDNLRVEQVTVTVDIKHQKRGELEIFLTSPSGTVSRLAEQHPARPWERPLPDLSADYPFWTFSSVHHWGESAKGIWKLEVRDRVSGNTGWITSAVFNLYGSTVGAIPQVGATPAVAAIPQVVPAVTKLNGVDVPSATLVSESNIPKNQVADPGEKMTFNIALKNIGGANSGTLTATLLNIGGVTGATGATAANATQNYGVLPKTGTVVTRPFSFTAGGASGTSSKLVLRLESGGVFIGYATTQIPLGAKTVTTPSGPSVNLTKIIYSSNPPASPYPAILPVTGIAGRVHNVRAKLNGLTYGAQQNMHVYLGGPTNVNVALFTDASTTGVTNKFFTFEDNAPTFFYRAGSTIDGNYRSWDYDYFLDGIYNGFTGQPATDEHGFTLGEFNGLNPNGNWRLYVENTSAAGTGTLPSWNVELTSVACTDNTFLTNPNITVNEDVGTITIGVTRTGGGAGIATVHYATEADPTNGDTATSGLDFTAVSGTLTFAPDEYTKEFTIPIINDSINELSETFRVVLSEPTGNTTLGTYATGTVTISNRYVPEFSLANTDIQVNEDAGSVTVTVQRDGTAVDTATVHYATSAESATPSVDYTEVSGTLMFAPGETTKDFTIPIINDTINEDSETIRITLASPTGNTTLGINSTGTVTILNQVILLTQLETWRLTYFGSSANSGLGADINDPDLDGIVNLVEYAFGLNPTVNSAGLLPQGQQKGANFVLEFTEPAGVDGFIYGAECSSTLLPNSWTPVPDTGSGTLHSFGVPNSTRPGSFMRLKVTRP